MAVLAVVIGLWIGVAIDSWIPFGISVVIALAIMFVEKLWMHDHIHESIKNGEEKHGIETIE